MFAARFYLKITVLNYFMSLITKKNHVLALFVDVARLVTVVKYIYKSKREHPAEFLTRPPLTSPLFLPFLLPAIYQTCPLRVEFEYFKGFWDVNFA